MRLSLRKAFFGSYAFEVCENVYEPAEDSFLFAENIRGQKSNRVLDLGTGSGILGIVAAESACHVVSVDVNPYAVRCAKRNAFLNGLSRKISFLRGDLFSCFREIVKFDLILFNAPYLPVDDSVSDAWSLWAWNGGATGRTVIDRFIAQAPLYLKLNGKIMLMQSSLAGVEETLRHFAHFHMYSRVLADLRLPFFETLILVEAIFMT